MPIQHPVLRHCLKAPAVGAVEILYIPCIDGCGIVTAASHVKTFLNTLHTSVRTKQGVLCESVLAFHEIMLSVHAGTDFQRSDLD